MTPREATRHVLRMDIRRPGVARLLQELLSEITGTPIQAEKAPPIYKLPGTEHIGGKGNPWGRAGKPTLTHP